MPTPSARGEGKGKIITTTTRLARKREKGWIQKVKKDGKNKTGKTAKVPEGDREETGSNSEPKRGKCELLQQSGKKGRRIPKTTTPA